MSIRAPLLRISARVFGLVVALSLALAAWAQEPVTLRFVVWDGDQSLRALRTEVDNFMKAHPNVNVRLESVEYSQYFSKLLAQYAADVAPDVVMMDPANFQRFAKRGALIPLNTLFGSTPDFDIKGYYEPLVRAHSYRDEVFVLPRDIAPSGLIYYNKKKFDEAGIPYPDGTWTWDFEVRPELREKDFIWVMQQLTKKEGRKRDYVWGFSPAWPEMLAQMFTFGQGARFVDNPEDPTKLLYNDPRVVRAYQYSADLGLVHGWIPTSTEIASELQSQANELFISQKVAMFMGGIWETPRFREALVKGTPQFFEWDIAMPPAYAGTGDIRMTTGGSGYGIMTSTRHREEAWALARWMAGPPGMMAMAKAGIAQPGIRELALQEPWIPGPNTPEDQQYPASRIITDEAVPFVVFEPTGELYREVVGIVQSPVERIFNGSEKAETVLARANDLAQKRLDTMIAERRALPKYNWTFGIGFGALLVGALLLWVYMPHLRSGRKLSRIERIENRVGYMFLMPWVLGMLLFTLGPMIMSLLMSFADWDIITPAKWRGLGNFNEAFVDDPRFWGSLRVTLIYTIISVPLGIIAALALALLLNAKVRGIPIYRTLFYLPALGSAVASALIWRRIFQPEGGLLNAVIYGPEGEWNLLGLGKFLSSFSADGGPANWLGVEQLALPAFIIMSVWGVGGGMVILLAGLQGIPQHYYEAATLDGAGPWNKFKAVTFPLLTPSLFFSLITGMIGSFQVFTQALVMTNGGPNNATRFFMLHLYEAAFGSLRMGYASALAWVLFIVIMAFTLVQFQLNRRVYYEAEAR